MAISSSELWRLLMESRLLAHEQCQHLSAEFAQLQPNASSNGAAPLAEWLISRNVITRYQSKLLLAGRPGPFFYGEYVVYDRVAQGRFAGSFRAVHAATSHPVLLRFLSGPLIENEAVWQPYAAWARAECGLIHPRFQRAFDLVDLNDYKFLVLEDLHGKSAAERIAEGRLLISEACGMVRDAAGALHDLHMMGRVHGDVRPKNIFIEGGAWVKVVRDFASPPGPFPWGQADPQGDLLERTNYLAPELGQSGRPPDVLTDVYALGCTLYETVSGRPPFPGPDMLQKMQMHATARIQPLEDFGAPPQLGQVTAYLMAKNPQVRFQDAASVAEQLIPFITPAQLLAYPPAPPPTLANYEAHLQSQREAAERQRLSGRRVVPAGVGNGGGAVVTAARPRASAAPNFEALAKVAPAVAPPAGPLGGPAIEAPAVAVPKRSEMTPQKLAIGLGAAAALVLVVMIGMSMMGGDDEPPPTNQIAANANPTPPLPDEKVDQTEPGSAVASDAPPAESNTGESNATESSTETAAVPPKATVPPPPVQEIVPDDGALLWASPTTGAPLDLSFSPPGSQLFFAFRPAEILASPHGSEAMQSLGPRFATLVKGWEDAAGVKVNEVDRLLVSLHDNNGEMPRVACVVWLKEPLDGPAILSRWGNPSPQAEGAPTYSARGWSFFIPPGKPGVFLMGAEPEVADVAKNPQAKPLLRREMERLLRASDADRHISVLFAPNSLFSDAQKLFSGDLKKLQEPLQSFLGDGLNAALASVHFGDRFYLEMRLYGTLDREKSKLASDMRARLATLPDQIEDYVARLSPHPYWRKLALRFPPMIRFLHGQTRVGAEDDHAVVNAVLPGVAAPNVLAAAELTLVSQPGSAYVGETEPAKPAVKDINELLDQKFSISFPNLSLDFAMRDVATEVHDSFPQLPFPFEIKLLGTDLQANGITQNQAIRDFEARDKSLKEILTAMVMKANPITTVKAPNETDQKLIWVVGPDPTDAAKQIILITTRDAAGAKKYTLPQAFQ